MVEIKALLIIQLNYFLVVIKFFQSPNLVTKNYWLQDLETKNWQLKIFGHLIQHHKISIGKRVVDVHFGR